jgi:hypothetical protein
MHIAYPFNGIREIFAVSIHYGQRKTIYNPIHVYLAAVWEYSHQWVQCVASCGYIVIKVGNDRLNLPVIFPGCCKGV